MACFHSSNKLTILRIRQIAFLKAFATRCAGEISSDAVQVSQHA